MRRPSRSLPIIFIQHIAVIRFWPVVFLIPAVVFSHAGLVFLICPISGIVGIVLISIIVQLLAGVGVT